MSTKIQSNQEIYDESSITNCKMEEIQIGKAIKASKRKLKWEFDTDGEHHFIELYDSKLSGKKKVISDGRTIFGPQT